MSDLKKTVVEVRDRLLEQATVGNASVCPICERPIKLYRRHIHTEMVVWLIGLYKLCRDGGWHTTLEIEERTDHLKAGGTNGTLLVHWGLIEKIPVENRGGGPAGRYRLTSLGEDFLHGKVSVPKSVFFLCNKIVGESIDRVKIRGALGNHFSYWSLTDA